MGIIALIAGHAKADQWRLHPTYSNYLQRIIDTPQYTYLLSGNQPYYSFATDLSYISNSLFRYDKGERETKWLNIGDMLSSPVVVTAEYNFEKNYLMVGYSDGNIDLIYDNGKVVNIPGLKLAEGYTKKINSITFAPYANQAYVATDFGYLGIDDEKGEIFTTRVLDRQVQAAVAFDSKVFVGTSDGLYHTSPRPGSDLVKIEGTDNVSMLTQLRHRLYMRGGEGEDGYISFITAGDSTMKVEPFFLTYVMGTERVKDGLLVDTPRDVYMLDWNSLSTHYRKPDMAFWKITSGCNGQYFWVNFGLNGVLEFEAQPDNNVWPHTGTVISANAANCYNSGSMAYSDRYGMLVRNHGIDYNFTSIEPPVPDYISGLNGTDWTPYSIAAVSPGLKELTLGNPNGLAIDPNDPDVAYCGSVMSGILKLNLANPPASLRFSRYNDAEADSLRFVGIVEPNSKTSRYTSFGAPAFDSYGNLWVLYNNLDKDKMELWHWTPEARLATVSKETYRPMKRWELDNTASSHVSIVLPLKASANRNIIALAIHNNNVLRVIDHQGTLDNRSDDRAYTFTSIIYDQDGKQLEHNRFRTMVEDPATGNVWVGYDRGVFWFNPREVAASGDTRVNRVKVPRNDGTNYADYLLGDVEMNHIAIDGYGRKWFATNGGGITCTSASGTEIIKTYTTENSMLPDNIVYFMAYNPSNNSMMVSTASGLAELYLSAASVEGVEDGKAVAYPNPVRPDFYGYVTIEGLEDGAVVKITDSAGNLIKELDRAVQGSTHWDVTNHNMKRVRSGVYYVLASGGPDNSGYAAVAKILVVN